MHRTVWPAAVAVMLLIGITALDIYQCCAQDLAPAVEEHTSGFGEYLRQVRWSPYVVGIGIGILSWIAFLLSDKPIGVSTAYARTSGMVEERLRGEQAVREKKYYQEYVPKIGWEWMLVAGLFMGAAVSAILSGDFRLEFVPPLWEQTFEHTALLRWITAFTGGVVMGVGARWASGCTSGHGISGTLQLVVSSWVAVICFFIGGVATAFLLYP